MRCVKFDRTSKPSHPISSIKCVRVEKSVVPIAQTVTESRARRSTVDVVRVIATEKLSRSQSLTVPSALKKQLVSPVSPASIETPPTTVQPVVTRGQTTRSEQTLFQTQSVKVEVSMPGNVKVSAGITGKSVPDLKPGGGRHPHPPTGNNKKLKHKCPFDGCPWKFATPYKLRRHIKSHTKETPYLCKECGRGFSVRYNLLMHIQTIHSQPQRYKCPVRGCKEAFHSQPRLNGHLRRIHKKDVKTIQTKAVSDGSDSRGNSTSSMDSIETSVEEQMSKAAPTKSRRKYECSECNKEFTTQAKLNIHFRVHSGEKPFKCSTEGCEKTFTSRDRLSKHIDTHKNARQFCCPHKNCNRVFLHQSHLKNHLKIHTQDHQFVCPVLDCSKKFNSESDYNTHLNTHINYGFKCTHPGCDLSFLSKKRLDFHCRAVHGIPAGFENGVHSSFLNGIQPHLGVNHQSSQLISPLLQTSVFSYPQQLSHHTFSSQPIKTENNDIFRDIDLPGLSQADMEALLSENKNWSGEQIDQFLRSAVDLSEIESNLFTSTGYESDSGYSTYDVSPITSTAPLSYPLHCQMGLQNGGRIEHAAGPMFNCTFSPTNSVFPEALPSTATSPASSETSFFSQNAELESVPTTSNQNATFFPGQATTQAIPMYSHHPAAMFGNTYFLEETNSGSSIPSFNSQIPEIMVQSAGQLVASGNKYLSCRRNSDSQVTLGSNCTKTSKAILAGQLVTQSLPNVGQMTHMVKVESQYGECAVMNDGYVLPSSTPINEHFSVNTNTQSFKTEAENGRRHSCSLSATAACLDSHQQTPQSNFPNQTSIGHRFIAPASHKIESVTTRTTTMKTSKKGKSSKTGPRRKNQWPRSMNKANMMAFRQHILNKLKKGQEPTTESFGTCIKQEASSPRPANADPNVEENSEGTNYEVQVMVQRNHSAETRSQSEPVESSKSGSVSTSGPLHTSQSASNVNSDSNMAVTLTDNDTSHLSELFLEDSDCSDILASFHFNPDSLLSGADEDHMLKTLGFDEIETSKVDDDIAALLGVGSDSLLSITSSTSDMMDLDCIQELLEDDQVSSSPLSLPLMKCNSPSLQLSVFNSLPPSPSLSTTSLQQGQSSPSPVCDTPQQTDYTYNMCTSSQYTIPVESLVSTTGVNECGSEVTKMAFHVQPSLVSSHQDTSLNGSGLFRPCTPEVFEI